MDREHTGADEYVRVDRAVGSDRAGMRMQDALPGLFQMLLPSRKSCRKAIDRGRVLLNGHRASTGVRVREGDCVALLTAPVTPVPPGPGAPKRLHMVRTGQTDWVLVWKPAGLATSGAGRLTLANVLAYRALHGSGEEREKLAPSRPDGMTAPHPVHRLDRATSGWVCTSLTLQAANSLGQAFAEQRVRKRYLALASGRIDHGGSELELDGKSCRTRWAALGSGSLPVHEEATLLEVTPETGRTHQIRRHLALSGHPLVGEDRYAAPGVDPDLAPRFSGHGLFLCAIGLTIPAGTHGPAADVLGEVPRKFKRIRWTAPFLDKNGLY